MSSNRRASVQRRLHRTGRDGPVVDRSRHVTNPLTKALFVIFLVGAAAWGAWYFLGATDIVWPGGERKSDTRALPPADGTKRKVDGQQGGRGGGPVR